MCHLCDIGIMEPFKTRLAGICQEWKVCKYSNMGEPRKVPTPTRINVLNWVNSIWNQFSTGIKNSFRECGFTDDVNLSINAASKMIEIYLSKRIV